MESYSVETMSGSFLSKFCVENWGDYSLKSSRGPKTRCCFLGSGVLLFFLLYFSAPVNPLWGRLSETAKHNDGFLIRRHMLDHFFKNVTFADFAIMQ